jgi:uncharacterized membrane protein YjjP (DUF1212 family)
MRSWMPDVHGAVAPHRQGEVMQAVENALELALLVMRNGGTTDAAERTFYNILAGYKLSGVTTIWRLDFVAATFTVDDKSSTLFRPVGTIGVNLSRTSGAVTLGERVADGTVAAAAVHAELERVRGLASPYSGWQSVLAAGIGAGAFSQFAGGDAGSFWVAAVAAAVGQLLRTLLLSRKVPVANVTLSCGLLSACLASAALHFGASRALPVTLVAALIYLAPGLPLINGFMDMTSQRHLLVGLERMMNAMYLFLILVIAIAIAYSLAGAF